MYMSGSNSSDERVAIVLDRAEEKFTIDSIIIRNVNHYEK
jgi:hypothetical protein